jgi:hypothetical protein
VTTRAIRSRSDCAIEDRALRRDVPHHVAVTIEMIRAEIEHRRGIEAESGDSLQHVGRHLKHICSAVRQQLERQGPRAEIAAGSDLPPAASQNVRK